MWIYGGIGASGQGPGAFGGSPKVYCASRTSMSRESEGVERSGGWLPGTESSAARVGRNEQET